MKQLAQDPVINFRTVGLALTLRCNYTCAHCINDSGPQQNEDIPLDEAIALISEISRESHNICFTGGESLLEKSKLLKCMQAAKEMGLTPSLVTNGFWAKNRETAGRMLRELADAGLSGICVSMDQFHLPFGTPEQALYTAELCKELKLNHVIRVCSTKRDDFADDFISKKRHPGVHFQRVPVLRMGRALNLPLELFKTKTEVTKECCNTALAPIILPNGKVQACCGPGIEFNDSNPLNLGNWKTDKLHTILGRARKHPLIAALHNIGPKKIANLLQENGYSVRVKDRDAYTGICELCVDMCNDPEVVHTMRSIFETPEIKLRLIAGQAYQQCYTYLEQENYLGLPGFS